jgi:hypothetical protein
MPVMASKKEKVGDAAHFRNPAFPGRENVGV